MTMRWWCVAVAAALRSRSSSSTSAASSTSFARRRRSCRQEPGRRTATARAPEDHALHAGHRQPGAAHQGGGRSSGDVHDVCLLQLRQARLLRPGSDEALHGVSLAARCGRCGRRGVGLQPGPMRSADGHPRHGDTQGMGRRRLGRQPENLGRRGHPRQYLERRLRVARGRDQGVDHPRQARGLRRLVGTRIRSTRSGSRTSRSSAQLWAATPLTKRSTRQLDHTAALITVPLNRHPGGAIVRARRTGSPLREAYSRIDTAALHRTSLDSEGLPWQRSYLPAEFGSVQLTHFTFNIPFVAVDPQKALRVVDRLLHRLRLEDRKAADDFLGLDEWAIDRR